MSAAAIRTIRWRKSRSMWILSEARNACGSFQVAGPDAESADLRSSEPPRKTRTAASTIRARGSAATIATGRATSRNCSARPVVSAGRRRLPRIHESVLKRIKNRAHAYAPVGLACTIRSRHRQWRGPDAGANPCEILPRRRARWQSRRRCGTRCGLRRMVYFLTVGVSVYLFAFPMMRAARPMMNSSPPGAGCRTSCARPALFCRPPRARGSMAMRENPASSSWSLWR